MNINTINKKIENHLFFEDQIVSFGNWRGENPNIVKKIASSTLLIGSSLVFLVDAIVSLTLAIFTSPLFLVGLTTSYSFAKRSIVSLMGAGACLTYGQYLNFSNKKFESF